MSIITYLGTFLGALSTIFIYPKDPEVYGVFRVLVDTANLLAPFVMLGSGLIVVRYFPMFKEENKGHNGFLFYLVLTSFLGFLGFLLFFLSFKDKIFNLLANKSPILEPYISVLPVLVLSFIYFDLLKKYSFNFAKISFSSILEQSIKLVFPILLVLYIFKRISLDFVVFGFVIHYFIIVVALIMHINSFNQLRLKPSFKKLSKTNLKEIYTYTSLAVLASVSGSLVIRIDTLMINNYINVTSVGIYSILAFMASIINIPLVTVSSVSTPIIVKAWADQDLKEVFKIYKKSCINLLLIGSYLFVGIWVCIDDVFIIMNKPGFHEAKLVILFLGLKSVVDMGMGVNDAVISYSKLYKFNFIAVILLGIFNVVGNIILVPEMGISGSALATFISILIYNIAKWFFINVKFKMQPFDLKNLYIIIVAILAGFCSYIVPNINPYINILLKGSIISIVFILAILIFKPSEEVNNAIVKYYNLLRSKFNIK